MRLLQFHDPAGKRMVGATATGGLPGTARLLSGFPTVYDLAREAIATGVSLSSLAERHLTTDTVSLETLVQEKRLLPPLDHPDPAHCLVSLTGLTHLGSAESRDRMHAAALSGGATDTLRLFQIGVEGGKPAPEEIGAQPEWAYKGDGSCVVAPEYPLTRPWFAEDGGEEAEIAGLYLIGPDGAPWRVGFALGNEFADHVLEKRNYLYLAHSKLRQCSFGPELLLGPLPDSVTGTVRIERNGETVWSSVFESGEAHMCHSIANLEQHHFKYELFRRTGDIHIHFFGANGVSFGAGVVPEPGDLFEIAAPEFGLPLRNPLRLEPGQSPVRVRML